MYRSILHHSFYSGIDAIAIVLCFAAIYRGRTQRSSWMLWAYATLVAAFVARTIDDIRRVSNWGRDFQLCWMAGDYALSNRDPYSVTGFLPPNDKLVAFVYPPTTLPFFKMLALAPVSNAITGWTAISLAVCISLGVMTRLALISQDGHRYYIVGPCLAALLTAPMFLSRATLCGLEAGQFSFLVTLSLLGALYFQGCKPTRPLLAAACLCVASIKKQTMLPFLLLFLRRSDLRIWLLFGLLLLSMLLAAAHPADWPRDFAAMISANVQAREPGRVGDFSLLNRKSHSMIGFDHALSRLGLVDMSTARWMGTLCVLALGLMLAYLVIRRPELPRGACAALISLYSMLFFYHRLYDLPILIIPLIYCASRVCTSSGKAFWCYAWVLLAVIMAINLPPDRLLHLQDLVRDSAVPRAVILPAATYLILSALGALTAATLLENPRQGSRP